MNRTLCNAYCNVHSTSDVKLISQDGQKTDRHSLVALLIYRVRITENALLTTVIKRSDTVQRAEQIENVRRRVFLGQAPAVVGGDSCGGGRGGGFALLVAHCCAQ